MKDLYVVNCCRTAIGSFGGSLKNTPAAEMGAVVVKEALARAIDRILGGQYNVEHSGPDHVLLRLKPTTPW